jgi:hypothetical protein
VTLPTIQSELALAILTANTALRRGGKPAAKVVLTLFNYGEISTEELLGKKPTSSADTTSLDTAGGGGVDAALMAFWPVIFAFFFGELQPQESELFMPLLCGPLCSCAVVLSIAEIACSGMQSCLTIKSVRV